MFAKHEIALLIVVVLPIAAIVAIDAYLAIQGETGTLLLPHVRRYPWLDPVPEIAPQPAAEAVEMNEEEAPLRKAA